jgi:ferredoxin
MYHHAPEIVKKEKSGHTRYDFAGALAAWTVYDYFHGARSWQKLSDANNVMDKPDLPGLKKTDPGYLSRQVKKIAYRFGACDIGICELNDRWIYSFDLEGNKIDIPSDFRYAVVMAVAMDPVQIKKSPRYEAAIETGIGYSHMAFCVSCLAEFIRYLGFKAIPMGNDTALSIPLAIDAGLGELGRLGLLVTPKHGPCVRICKVFTDMPLIPDRPISFGLAEFCRNCSRCVKACAAEAIDDNRDPSYDAACPSNNPGIKRWAVNHDRCYHFWIENGSDCSSCIAVCPFTSGAMVKK